MEFIANINLKNLADPLISLHIYVFKILVNCILYAFQHLFFVVRLSSFIIFYVMQVTYKRLS